MRVYFSLKNILRRKSTKVLALLTLASLLVLTALGIFIQMIGVAFTERPDGGMTIGSGYNKDDKCVRRYFRDGGVKKYYLDCDGVGETGSRDMNKYNKKEPDYVYDNYDCVKKYYHEKGVRKYYWDCDEDRYYVSPYKYIMGVQTANPGGSAGSPRKYLKGVTRANVGEPRNRSPYGFTSGVTTINPGNETVSPYTWLSGVSVANPGERKRVSPYWWTKGVTSAKVRDTRLNPYNVTTGVTSANVETDEEPVSPYFFLSGITTVTPDDNDPNNNE